MVRLCSTKVKYVMESDAGGLRAIHGFSSAVAMMGEWLVKFGDKSDMASLFYKRKRVLWLMKQRVGLYRLPADLLVE